MMTGFPAQSVIHRWILFVNQFSPADGLCGGLTETVLDSGVLTGARGRLQPDSQVLTNKPL